MNKQILLPLAMLAVLAVTLAPTLNAIDNAYSQQIKPENPGKPDKEKPNPPQKEKFCKAQVKVILTGNLVVGQYYTVKIGDGKEQIKLAEAEEGEELKLVFNYNINKQKTACPLEVPVTIDGSQYAVSIVGKKNTLEVVL